MIVAKNGSVGRALTKGEFIDFIRTLSQTKSTPYAPEFIKCPVCGDWVEAKDAAKHYEDNHTEKDKEKTNG